MESAELSAPLLRAGVSEEQEDATRLAGFEPGADAGSDDGDVEQALLGRSSSDAGSAAAQEDKAIEAAARASHQSGPAVYVTDVLRLALFFWAIVSDALLLKELYATQHLLLAGIATGFTVGPHVLMSLLLIVRQGWLAAAGQACGFILTLNPFETLTPIPQGVLGLCVVSVGFIAYVLIAASGLIFVAYCVVCYLVTALLFSLLILDLAALVITVAPSKAFFKYTDLVYTENFKFSRLVLQAWLQSAPELCVIGVILYRNASAAGPAVLLRGPILLQALVAHLLNLVDKTLLFRASAALSGCGAGRQLLLVLGVRGSCRLSLPVLKENLSRALRGTGGSAGAGLGSVLHISSFEEPQDTDSEAAASMVPEYLTPNNGGLLSPGQFMVLSRAVLDRYGGPGVAELVLEATPSVRLGKLLSEAVARIPNVSTARFVNASLRGADAGVLATALLQWSSLRTLQLHQATIDERGAHALAQLLDATPTLQQLDLCRCKLRRRAATALAQGLRVNKTLRQLNLAGCKGLDEAGASALAAAVAVSKVLTSLNLAFVKLGGAAVDSLVQALNTSSSLRVVAVSQAELAPECGAKLVAAISAASAPKAPPSLAVNLTLGTFAVQGLEHVQFLAVADQDALLAEAWQGLAGPGGAGDGLELLEPDAAAAPGLAGWAFAARGASGTGDGGSAASDAAGSSGSAASGVPELESSRRPAAAPRGQESPAAAAAASSAAAFAAGSSSSSSAQGARPAQLAPPPSPPHPPASAFGVVSPLGAATPSGAAALLPNAAAAWFSGAAGSAAPAPPGGSGGSAGAGTSKAAEAGACPPTTPPCLVFVVTQEECVPCMVKAPLLFGELDTLDLTGLGIGDEGAAGFAKTLRLNPGLRRAVLSDNHVSEEGGAALADALAVNTALQVLDLSGNEFSEAGVDVLADAARHAAGLRQLRLLGNKIPFGLATLRKLMQAEAANPQCRLVLVEDPAEVLDELEAQGDTEQAARAADFYQRQEQYRQQRRQRIQARQQRLARLDAQQAAEAAAASADAASALPRPPEQAPGGADAAGAAQQPSPPAAPAQLPLQPSVSGGPGEPLLPLPPTAAAAAAAAASPRGSGSLSSITTDEDTCGICFDNSNHVAVKYCGHRLCVDCYRRVWELGGGDATCPFCRARLQGYLYLDLTLDALD